MKRSSIISLVFLLAVCNCATRHDAKGPSDVIYVLASDEVRSKVQVAIDTTFSYGIRTPEFERYFYTDWRPLNLLAEYIKFPNTIIVADMNHEDAATSFIRSLLTAERQNLIKQDTVAMFALEDYWCNKQMLILIAGYDLDQLSAYIMERQAWIYSKFDKKYIERQSRFLYNRLEQKKVADQLLNNYHWTMRVPSDYLILSEDPAYNFVWLGRGQPYCWISVSWADGIQTEWLTPNGLFKKREIIGTLYRQIKTEKRFLGYHYEKLAGWDALRMYGLWYNEGQAQGGPFVTYAFYDKVSDRSFVIDMMVYYPGRKNTPYIRYLEIMAHTFRTIANQNQPNS
jgi:hypothetical protein